MPNLTKKAKVIKRFRELAFKKAQMEASPKDYKALALDIRNKKFPTLDENLISSMSFYEVGEMQKIFLNSHDSELILDFVRKFRNHPAVNVSKCLDKLLNIGDVQSIISFAQYVKLNPNQMSLLEDWIISTEHPQNILELALVEVNNINLQKLYNALIRLGHRDFARQLQKIVYSRKGIWLQNS